MKKGKIHKNPFTRFMNDLIKSRNPRRAEVAKSRRHYHLGTFHGVKRVNLAIGDGAKLLKVLPIHNDPDGNHFVFLIGWPRYKPIPARFPEFTIDTEP